MRAFLLRTVALFLVLILCAPSYARSDAAAALLAAPDEGGWSLEAMVAAGWATRVPEEKPAEPDAADAARAVKTGRAGRYSRDADLAALRRQVRSLKAELADARREDRGEHGAPEAAALVRARRALKESESRMKALAGQVENLKTALEERDSRLRALDNSTRELTALREALAGKEKQVAALTPAPGEKDRVEALTLAIADRDNALAGALARAERAEADLTPLKAQLAKQEKNTADLRTALEARSGELKQAAAGLADLRAKHKPVVPSTPAQQQAYMAGQMMADGLNRRLEGWTAAGVNIDTALFHSGLKDGLARTVRLKPPGARDARAAFMKAVQDGVASRVAQAQKQLSGLAKGRTALKSQHGITWYRVRTGRAVEEGQPVRLAMTERVAGGKAVSRVPALTLRPGDTVPAVVRDGMYLPGEGGEVVAYALARDVYGELPLPAGVQPWTVMEYHLTGEPQPARHG